MMNHPVARPTNDTERAFNRGVDTLQGTGAHHVLTAESRRNTFHSADGIRAMLFADQKDQSLLGGVYKNQSDVIRKLRFFLFGISFLLASLIAAMLATSR